MLKDPQQKLQLKRQMEMQSLNSAHAFWGTMPMIKPAEQESIKQDSDVSEPLVPTTEKKTTSEPAKLPDEYDWYKFSITFQDDIKMLCEFLKENYIEDVDAQVRPQYSELTLNWLLNSQGSIGKWHVAIIEKKTKSLVGFIAATPLKLSIRKKTVNSALVNFLCVKKSLQSKKFTPFLISELQRRTNERSVSQCIFGCRKIMPTPITQVFYFHRFLDVKTLLAANFTTMPSKMNMKSFEKMNTIHSIALPNFRKVAKKDKKDIITLLNKEYSQLDIAPIFDEKDSSNLQSRDKVLSAFVVEEKSVVTDFISYYVLNLEVTNKDATIKEFKCAYLYYYSAPKVGLEAMLRAVMEEAKKEGCALFSAMGYKGNEDTLARLQFVESIDSQFGYLFNWKCAPLKASKFGVLMP